MEKQDDDAGIQKVAEDGNILHIQMQEQQKENIPAANERLMKTDQASQYERVFKHFDEDGDGKISPAELRQCFEAIGGKLSTEDVEAAVAILDTDYELRDAFEMYEMDNDFSVSDHKFFRHRDRRFWMRAKDYDRWKRMCEHALIWQNKKAKRENLLPLFQNDLKNMALEQNDLNCKPFLSFALGSVLDIPPQQHGILLMLCASILISYQAKNSTTPFDNFQLGKPSKNTPHSLLSFNEAFETFLPEMTHITMFMLCYIMTWMLVLPLRPGVQIFLVLLLIYAPLFYFPELVRKASNSGVDVVCGGSFKLPLIWFATLGAFGICLIFGLVALLMFYLSWRFVYRRTPTRGKDIEVSSDGLLSMVLDG